jgi:hypothetical protein
MRTPSWRHVALLRWRRIVSVVAALAAVSCGGSVREEDPRGSVSAGHACSSNGAMATLDDGCNRCVCSGGSWSCTRFDCSGQCTLLNEIRVLSDGCNLCGCMPDGEKCTQAACPATLCGGFLPDTCAPTEYCAYSEQHRCGTADDSAVCRGRPDSCGQEFAPVCGCNLKTYDNGCLANMDGAGVLRDGPCSAPPQCIEGELSSDGTLCECTNGSWSCLGGPATPVCAPGETKAAGDGCNTCSCVGTGQWQCTRAPCGKSCVAANACASSEYCAFIPGQYCGLVGGDSVCMPRPEACSSESAPVCGCDQKTYDNACKAAMAGTGIYSKHPCLAK